MNRATLSIAETAEVFGVSQRLIYDLVDRGELPSIELGRRKLVPARAVELVLEAAVDGFDPNRVLAPLAVVAGSSSDAGEPGDGVTTGGASASSRPGATRGEGSTGTAGVLALVRPT